jgi:hypothetical protein
MTLPAPTATRLYARTSGCLFLVLAFLSVTFFAGLAYLGIDGRPFMFLPLVLAILGLLLLVARGLGVLLPLASVVGFASVAFWAWAWVTSHGFDWGNFVLPMVPSLLGGFFALRGWVFLRRGRRVERQDELSRTPPIG